MWLRTTQAAEEVWKTERKQVLLVVECLRSMAVLGEESSQDVLSYTKCWMAKVNRGGLVSLNNRTFQFFCWYRENSSRHFTWTCCWKNIWWLANESHKQWIRTVYVGNPITRHRFWNCTLATVINGKFICNQKVKAVLFTFVHDHLCLCGVGGQASINLSIQRYCKYPYSRRIYQTFKWTFQFQ